LRYAIIQMKTISYTISATRQLRKLPAEIRERIIDKLRLMRSPALETLRRCLDNRVRGFVSAAIESFSSKPPTLFRSVLSGIEATSTNE
jgi:hypothetical protein